jgi:hypothetical protein
VHDGVVATSSVAGPVSVIVGSNQTVSITFNSTDGRTVTGLAINGSLGALPAGWSGPADFGCQAIGRGSGCVLNLTYAPTAIGSGTLTLQYVFLDAAGSPQTIGGSMSLTYVATVHNNIVAAASPTGEITALAGAASQPVVVNFTTDDGNPASGLALTTSLASLPAGWSTTATSFTCDAVSTGNGCQLALSYAPDTVGSGTLTLSYGYLDNSGTAKTGSLNIAYAATTHDDVVASAAPSGQVNAVVGSGSQPVVVTFLTNDGNPASNLVLATDLTALPAGWSSAVGNLACVSVSTGNGCQLAMTFAPSAAASGTLTLTYGYDDDAGTAKTGTLNISYAATQHDHVVTAFAPSSQIDAVAGVDTVSVSITFTTDDGNPAQNLSITSGLASLPPGWSSTAAGTFNCATVSTGTACQLSLTYAPTVPAPRAPLTLGFSYDDDAGTPQTGTLTLDYSAT